MLRSILAPLALFAAFSALLAACGGSGSETPPPMPPDLDRLRLASSAKLPPPKPHRAVPRLVKDDDPATPPVKTWPIPSDAVVPDDPGLL